jgi:hypothetical protein
VTAEAKIAASVFKSAVDWVRGQVKRDRNNRYSLLRDWTLPATVCSFWPDALSGWESPLFRISRLTPGVVSITVRAYTSTEDENICDGATLSPDTPPGILPAALFHDPWYATLPGDPARQYELLADALGVKRKTLRKFGDALFYSIAVAGGCPRWLAWTYHAGIRVGFPIVRPFIVAIVLASLAAGCAGCIGPDGTFTDPGDYQPPAWEQVQ